MESIWRGKATTRGTKARYFIGGLLTAVLFLPVVILEGDTIPLTFKSGDIISASVMNQLFARINATTQLPTQQSLVGVWKCAETLPGTQWLNPPSTYTLDATGLFATRQNTLTFAAGGSANALTVTSTAGVPLQDDNLLLNSSTAAVAPVQNDNLPVGTAVWTGILTFRSKAPRHHPDGGPVKGALP